MYSLSTSFWIVPVSCARRHALLLGDQLVEQQQHGGRGVDRHRRRDLVERDAVEQHPHVVDRVDRDADLADLAVGERVVGVVAHLGRQVEGHRQPGLPGREQLAGSGRWTPPRCRSRRTAAWSTGGRCTSSGRRRGCTGTRPGSPSCPAGSHPARASGPYTAGIGRPDSVRRSSLMLRQRTDDSRTAVTGVTYSACACRQHVDTMSTSGPIARAGLLRTLAKRLWAPRRRCCLGHHAGRHDLPRPGGHVVLGGPPHHRRR